ncbi:MAG: YfcE family phosphodiesterase [Spirochaetia bacterium]|nr:YfcE family phosphodiesterase [Spirochaetia bacterium]
MMRIFVFSDLHGNIPQLEKVIKRIDIEKATHVIFAGDLGITQLGDAKELLYSITQQLTIVRGNIDQLWLFMTRETKVPLVYTSIPFEGRTIAITHGDYFSSWKDIPLTLTKNDIFITGHTHIPYIGNYPNQPILLNPGSSSEPRGSYEPSYAIIGNQSIQIKSIDSGKQLGSFLTYLSPIDSQQRK